MLIIMQIRGEIPKEISVIKYFTLFNMHLWRYLFIQIISSNESLLHIILQYFSHQNVCWFGLYILEVLLHTALIPKEYVRNYL
jgi:hypothetical protein